MKRRPPSFSGDQQGVTAVEFALIAPVFLGMLMGITQLGALYFARADLRQAVAAGARHAQIFPRPNTATINSTIQSKMIRLQSNRIAGPTITYNSNAAGYEFADIEVGYAVPLNFVFYKPAPVTLTVRRRVFLQPT